MKLRLMKRIIATGLCATLLFTGVLSVSAVTSVSDGDAVNNMQADDTVSGNDLIEIEEEDVPLMAAPFARLAEVEDTQMVNVTVNHYLSSNNSVLFIPYNGAVEDGGSLSGAGFIKGEGYYDYSKITMFSDLDGDGIKDADEQETDVTNQVTAANGKLTIDVEDEVENAVVNIYYTSATGTYRNDVSMFDYVNGGGYDSKSINYYKNYPTHSEYQLLDQQNNDNRLATINANGDYQLMVWSGGEQGSGVLLNANAYNNSNNIQKTNTIIKGLLAGLEGDNYETVKFAYEDPGFFSSDPKNGKEILNGYSAEFDRDGMQYTLSKIYDAENDVVCSNVNDFFPLNKKNGNKKNEYFGLRYDFTFEIGDYLGDMVYSFVGDDDLWVCMDGSVILDLGGIHDAYPNANTGILDYAPSSVDLWAKLLNKENYTTQDKMDYANAHLGEEHTITVLFMERGGYASNCQMSFTVPKVKAKDPVVDTAPKAGLELLKRITDTTTAIPEVGFTLYKDEALTNDYLYQETDGDGKITFNGLREGTYYLKETKYDADTYLENETVYTVNVTVNDGVATATIAEMDEKVGDAYVIYNTPVPTLDIEFTKIDRYYPNHSLKLAGAQFTLKEVYADGTMSANPIQTSKVTGADGLFTFTDLKAGKYFAEEIQAPAGYRLPATGSGLNIEVYEDAGELKSRISHTGNGSQIYFWTDGQVNFVENMKGIDVTITKEWKDFSGQVIDAPADVQGISVELRRKGTSWDEKVADVTLSAENNWAVTLEDLDYACDQGVWTYYIKEKTLVDGYTAEYSDVVMDTDTEGEYSAALTVTNVQKPGALKIVKTVDKVDAVDGLASFTFEIKCADGTTLYRTLTFEAAGTKEVVVDNLPAGGYTVTELDALRYELKEGYEKEQTKTVVPEGTTEFEYSNEKVFENFYSHTDVAVNKVIFTKDAEGNITDVTWDRVKSSTDEIVKNTDNN